MTFDKVFKFKTHKYFNSQVVSRLLKELEKQGLLELKRGKIHIRGDL